MTATVKTKKGVHKISLDRWGDSTHKLSAYNSRHKPSFRDERQIERMETETMVLCPTPMPNPVIPQRNPGLECSPEEMEASATSTGELKG